jgi:hypothetical protein
VARGGAAVLCVYAALEHRQINDRDEDASLSIINHGLNDRMEKQVDATIFVTEDEF